MKTLLLIRHAKSDWSVPSLGDFHRVLNERGLKDAPRMAERLKKRQIPIDAFISSTAKRAFTTAEFFARAFDLEPERIIKEPDLYHATPDVFRRVVEDCPDEFSTIALFSHNPGITDFVNSLTRTRLDNMPTCGIFAVKIHTEKWMEYQKAEKEFLFFDYPKLAD
ncbi:MAG: histidine phosphatase family protein [Chitinophagaceae bacterium]|nr:histidine phosphatase family protein [Chitinophagaceae bacterium]